MTEHYFSEKQTSELKLKELQANLRGFAFSFFTSSGIFASKRLDNGSKLLAEKMVIGKDDDVLEMGCGNGVVGMVAARLTAGQVVLTDINPRACKVARINTKRVKNIKVLCGDMYEPVSEMKFDVILLNPPQTAGKKVCFEMIEKASGHLKGGGSLQVVARHNKGGETLSKKMVEVYGNMETVARQGGFRVYLSRKNP